MPSGYCFNKRGNKYYKKQMHIFKPFYILKKTMSPHKCRALDSYCQIRKPQLMASTKKKPTRPDCLKAHRDGLRKA